MAISRALRQLCPHTVSIELWSSQNSYGEPSYAAAATYSCLIEKRPRLVRALDGKEVVSGAAVYLTEAVSGLTPKARVTLPDGSTPVILSVSTFPNKSGDYFSVIHLDNRQS